MAPTVDPSKLVAFMRDDLGMSAADVLEHFYEDATIPATAFKKPLTPLETVCTYLRDHYEYATSKIAQETGRPYNSVRAALANADKKGVAAQKDAQTPYRVPAAALQGDLSPAQAVAHHLATEYELSSSEVADLIGRDQRNVASMLARAHKRLTGDER